MKLLLPYTPTEKQLLFHNAREDEVLYGGAAGGGGQEEQGPPHLRPLRRGKKCDAQQQKEVHADHGKGPHMGVLQDLLPLLQRAAG